MWDGLESVEIGEGREEILKKNFRLFLWTLEDSRDGDRQRTFDQTNSQDVQFLRFLNTMDSAKSIAYALVSETIAREGSKLEGTSQLGVAGQKPAKTPGKKVRQFESPVRTKKVRFLPESISNKDRKPVSPFIRNPYRRTKYVQATNGPVTPTPHFSIDESQPLEERLLDLTSKIAKTTESRKAFSNTDFSRNEAQLIADYLNIVCLSVLRIPYATELRLSNSRLCVRFSMKQTFFQMGGTAHIFLACFVNLQIRLKSIHSVTYSGESRRSPSPLEAASLISTRGRIKIKQYVSK